MSAKFNGECMPGGWAGGQAVMWDAKPAKEAPAVAGAYPVGFLQWAKKVMVCGGQGLHISSGGLGWQHDAMRVDVRLQQCPDVVADGTNLPFADGAFAWSLVDPPYSQKYADRLYNTGGHYPSPNVLVKEAARVSQDVVGMVHFTVPFPPKGWKIQAVYGVTQGPGYAIRALTVIRR